jgi:hypothetical protein
MAVRAKKRAKLRGDRPPKEERAPVWPVKRHNGAITLLSFAV